MSALGQKRTLARLFNHLVCYIEQPCPNGLSLHNQRLTAPSVCRYRILIDYVNWSSSRKGDDLVENVAKLRLVFLVSHIANVRRRNNLFKLQQRQIHIPHWLSLKHVDSSKARPTSTERSYKRTWLYQRCATGVDQNGAWLHACQVRGLDDMARNRY